MLPPCPFTKRAKIAMKRHQEEPYEGGFEIPPRFQRDEGQEIIPTEVMGVAHRALFDRQIGVPACCSEGCVVEPDGTCPHGNPSILKHHGLI